MVEYKSETSNYPIRYMECGRTGTPWEMYFNTYDGQVWDEHGLKFVEEEVDV